MKTNMIISSDESQVRDFPNLSVKYNTNGLVMNNPVVGGWANSKWQDRLRRLMTSRNPSVWPTSHKKWNCFDLPRMVNLKMFCPFPSLSDWKFFDPPLLIVCAIYILSIFPWKYCLYPSPFLSTLINLNTQHFSTLCFFYNKRPQLEPPKL